MPARAATAALLLALLAACLAREAPGDPAPPSPPAPTPTVHAFYLQPGHGLAPALGNRASPAREPAYPTANAYTNEDIERFASERLAGLHVTRARVIVHYDVDRPTADTFRPAPTASDARHFVFWLGSGGVFPGVVTTLGPPVLVPGERYAADVDVPLPVGGWVIAPGEALEVLVAPLILHAGPPNLYYLVDHASAPSRIELEAVPWTAPPPATGAPTDKPFTVAANGGLFTGAVPAEHHTVREAVAVPPDATHGRLDVRWVSTAAPKSDLDFLLLAPDGTTVASSTTPYQNESIRLFPPNLAALPSPALTAVVDVYSGVDTTFRLVVAWAAAPAPGPPRG